MQTLFFFRTPQRTPFRYNEAVVRANNPNIIASCFALFIHAIALKITEYKLQESRETLHLAYIGILVGSIGPAMMRFKAILSIPVYTHEHNEVPNAGTQVDRSAPVYLSTCVHCLKTLLCDAHQYIPCVLATARRCLCQKRTRKKQPLHSLI